MTVVVVFAGRRDVRLGYSGVGYCRGYSIADSHISNRLSHRDCLVKVLSHGYGDVHRGLCGAGWYVARTRGSRIGRIVESGRRSYVGDQLSMSCFQILRSSCFEAGRLTTSVVELVV